MADVQGVSVAFGQDAYAAAPTYTRIDDAAHESLGLHVSGWRTKRGRSYFTDRTEAGTAGADFIDAAGVLDPTNSTGPFYPMDPNCPCAIGLHDPVAGTWHTVYTGMVEDAPQSLDVSARFSKGSLTSSDILSLLATAEVPPGIGYAAQASGTYAASKSTSASGDTTYAAQQVDDRLRAILADAGVPAALTTIFSGNVNLQGCIEPPGSSILEMLWNAADSEFPGVANLYASKYGLVTFHGRLARFNPTDPTYGINTWHVGDHAAVAASPTTTALISGLSFGRDVAKVINAALFAPANIRETDTPGQFASDAPSVAKYGVRSYTGTDLLTLGGKTDGRDANAETALYGAYYVDNFKDAQTRITRLTVTNVRPTAPNAAAHWAFMCGVEIGDLVDVTTTHPGGGGFSAEPYFVEGIAYDAKPSGDPSYALVTMTLDLSPQAYFTTNPGF